MHDSQIEWLGPMCSKPGRRYQGAKGLIAPPPPPDPTRTPGIWQFNPFSIRGQIIPTTLQLGPPPPRDFQTFLRHCCQRIGLRRLSFLSYVVLCALHLLLYYITVKRRTSCQESRQKDFRRWTRNTMHCNFFCFILASHILLLYAKRKKTKEKKT